MMKKRNFVIKVLRYITIILFLLIIMIVVIKKWHSFARISVLFNINWVDIQLGKIECSLLLFYAKILAIYIIAQNTCDCKLNSTTSSC